MYVKYHQTIKQNNSIYINEKIITIFYKSIYIYYFLSLSFYFHGNIF
jgi:hypothetical protein